MYKFQELGEKLSQSLNRLETDFKRLEEIEQEDSEHIRLYATLLVKLGINLNKGRDLLNVFRLRYDNRVSEFNNSAANLTRGTNTPKRSKLALRSQISSANRELRSGLASRNSSSALKENSLEIEKKFCYMTLSGNRDNIGIILSSNKEVHQLFGYPSEDVFGVNISNVMPKFFATRHDGFIKRYLGRSTNVQERNYAHVNLLGYPLDADRHLLLIEAKVKIIPDLTQGIILFA